MCLLETVFSGSAESLFCRCCCCCFNRLRCANATVNASATNVRHDRRANDSPMNGDRPVTCCDRRRPANVAPANGTGIATNADYGDRLRDRCRAPGPESVNAIDRRRRCGRYRRYVVAAVSRRASATVELRVATGSANGCANDCDGCHRCGYDCGIYGFWDDMFVSVRTHKHTNHTHIFGGDGMGEIDKRLVNCQTVLFCGFSVEMETTFRVQ